MYPNNPETFYDQDAFKVEIERVLQDYSVSKDDKPPLKKEALKTGSIEIPISNYLKNFSKLTKIELQDFTTPFHTTDELFSLLDTNHLPLEAKQMMRNCCEDNFKAFSSFTFNIGRTQEEATVETTTDEQLIQKYYPISPAVHNEVEEILHDLCRLGIIRKLKTNEFSQFTNCLIVLRKSSGKLRLIVDTRLVNLNTQTNSGSFTSVSKILASLPPSTKVTSSLDLSQGFFNIPVERKSQAFFSFYSTQLVKYAFTRCVMGCKNSNIFLQQALIKALKDLKMSWYWQMPLSYTPKSAFCIILQT